MIECVLQMVNKNIAMSLTIIVVILVNKYFRKANYQTKYLNYLIATVGLIVPLQFIWRINTSASNLSYSTIENVKRLVNSSNTFITDNLQTSVKLSTSFQLDLATIAMIVYILGILILTIIIGIKYFSLIRYINHWRVDDQRLNNEFRQL